MLKLRTRLDLPLLTLGNVGILSVAHARLGAQKARVGTTSSNRGTFPRCVRPNLYKFSRIDMPRIRKYTARSVGNSDCRNTRI